jgi:hypothetical protein
VAVPPNPLELNQIQALVRPLGADELGGVVPTRFPSLIAAQISDMIWKFFSALNVTQVIEPIEKSFPSFSTRRAFEMIRNLFGRLKATEAVELVYKMSPGQHAKQEFPPSMKRGQQSGD